MNKAHRMIKDEMEATAVKIRQMKLDRKEKSRAGEEVYKIEWNITRLKKDFRLKHIARGLLKGLAYDQIETPAEGNEPDWDTIERLKTKFSNLYKEHAVTVPEVTAVEETTIGLNECIACM